MLVAWSGCTYKSMIRDEEWVYFEEWDSNDDSKLDSNEFANGYDDSKIKGNESAQAVFSRCDENEDGVVSALAFYKWEANRDAPAKRDSAA